MSSGDDDGEVRVMVVDDGGDDEDDEPDVVAMEEVDIPDEESDSGQPLIEEMQEVHGAEPDELALPGEPGYIEREAPADRRKRLQHEEEAYYADEYGVSKPDIVRLHHTETANFFGDDPRFIDEDDEPEEHIHGMVLPTVDLSDKQLYYRELMRVLCNMGTELTRLLTQLLVSKKPLTPPDRNRCNAWVKYWTSYLVEHHYEVLGKIISIPTGPNGQMEKLSGSMCIMAELWRMKLILNHHRLDQLCKWTIGSSPFLVKWLVETPGVPLDCPPKAPAMKQIKGGGMPTEADQREYQEACQKYKTELTAFEASQKIVDTPVFMLKQAQVRRVVQYLTAKLRIVPYHEDIRMLIETLELKNAIFFCQTMPGSQLNDPKFRTDMQREVDRIVADMQTEMSARVKAGLSTASEYADAMRDAYLHQQQQLVSGDGLTEGGGGRFTVNRDYWIFMTCYFYPLTRALYYVDMFPLMRLDHADNIEAHYLPAGAAARAEKWCRDMAKHQGDKYFERLEDAAGDAMNNPGDMEWHLYKYPDESTNVAVVVRKGRGEAAYEDYHEQTGLSATVILDQVNVNWLSTTYVINLIDRYFNAYKSTNWQDGYVIHNPFIDEEETFDKWTISREPFLINVFNSYWLLLDRKVLPMSNVYVAFCMWLQAIRKTRKNCAAQPDCLSDNTYIGDVIDTILLGKGNITYSSQKAVDEGYKETLRRGLPVHVTRVHI